MCKLRKNLSSPIKLISNSFVISSENSLHNKIFVDPTLVQIYVDDIIFGSTKLSLCKKFSDLMTKEFEMSLMGELKFFLGLQIIQASEGIFINQSKYIRSC